MLSFGQLFGSNFWSSFKSQPSESIEKLLKQENCPVEELLDDGDLLQECKNNNKNLINYLNREKVKQLIDFITVMPEEDEHNRGHKYPFLASELFNCDIAEITDMFFTAPCDDKKPEPEEEEEDTAKFESNFEKDHDDSDSEGDGSNEGEYNEADDAQKTEEITATGATEGEMKVEEVDTPAAENDQDAQTKDEPTQEDQKQDGESAETPTTTEPETEAKDGESETLDVEEPVQQKSLETPEDTKSEEKVEETQPETTSTKTPVAATEAPEETKTESDATPTETQSEETPAATEPEKTEPAEVPNTEESNDAATPATEPEAEDVPEKTSEETKQAFESETDTQVSEAATEVTTTTEPQEPLSDNKYDLLDYLNSFIDTDDELNDVLSGYYARLVNILLQKKSDEVRKYFFEHEEHLYRLAYHSYSKSITDTLVKILDISMEKIDKEESEVNRIRAEFIKRLVGRLADDSSEVAFEYSLNIFQIFSDMSYKKVYYNLLTEESVLNTLGEILKNGAPEIGSNAAVRIFNILVTNIQTIKETSQMKQTTFKWGNEDEDDVLLQDEEPDAKAEENENLVKEHPLTAFVTNTVVDYLVDQLEIPPTKSIIDFQYGDNKFVLGKKRLACINLMETLIELNDTGLKEKIMSTNFYKHLFHLFLEFPLNTFLQLHFDTIFGYLIRDEVIEMSKKVQILSDIGLAESLPSYWQDNQTFVFPSQREFRHGYLAFTTKLANLLKETAKNSPELLEMLSTEEIKEFYEKDVEVYNEKNSIVLASRGRADSNEGGPASDDDEMRFDNLEEREDIDDDDDDNYGKSRTSMRETLQAYDPNRAADENEDDYVNENVEVDGSEDKLFSGINRYQDNSSSDEDTPIGDAPETDNTSESSDYYDNNFWQVSQYSIEDLLGN